MSTDTKTAHELFATLIIYSTRFTDGSKLASAMTGKIIPRQIRMLIRIAR